MGTSVADLFVVLDSVTEPFSRGMKKASADAEVESKRMSGAIGAISKVTLGVGLAVAGIGVASIKAASEFQTQMTRLYTAAGAPKAAVQGATSAILAMGTQVGMTGTQMAEALYHPVSAGLDMATSLQVVKYAAEEAQISGASLDDTTYSLSSVMKAFNEPASQAAQTMSDLNAVVGDGDMRFQDFNASIKNWAPTAAQMGLSVDSMGAGLAYLTDRGNSAEEASTRLTMGISMMATPSKKAAGLLEGLGVASSDVTASSKEMADVLKTAGVTQNQLAADLAKPDGLYVALSHLQGALEKAGVKGTEADSAIAKVFGGGRSDKAILSLMQNLDGLKQKYDQVTSDSTTKKFEANWEGAKQTFGFQIHQMEVGIENFGIRLGTKALPALSQFITTAEKDLAPFFGEVGAGFSQLTAGFEGTTVQGPTVNLHNAHLNQDQSMLTSQAAAATQMTTLAKIGRLAKETADDLARFGRDGYDAMQKILQVARPVGEAVGTYLGAGLKAVGWTLANVVGPALKFFADFLASHQGAIKFFADVVLGGLILKMTILGGINAAKGIVGLATSIVSFPLNQASAIGDAYKGLKSAVSGSEMKDGEQAVKGLSGAFSELKGKVGGIFDRFALFDSGKLAALSKAGQDIGAVEKAVGSGEQLALFEADMAGITQVAEKAPEQLALFDTAMLNAGGAAATAEKSAGSLLGTLGKFALAGGIVGAIVGGAVLIGTTLGKLTGVGDHLSTTLDQTVKQLQLAAEGSTSAGQQIASQAAAWVKAGSLGSAGVSQVDQALTQMLGSGHAADAATEFDAISQLLEKTGMSAKDAAAQFPQYEQALKDAGDAAQTMDGQVSSMLAGIAKQQALTGFQTDLQSVTDAIKSNGKSLMDNSAAAQANRTAIATAAADVANFYQQQRSAGVGIGQATTQMDQQIVALEQTAIKTGLSKGEVDSYIATLLNIPVSRVTKIIADTSSADWSLNTLLKRIDTSVGTITVSLMDGGATIGNLRGPIGHKAGGGPVEGGNTYWVGEHGPELVTFGASGYVTPTTMLQPAILAGAPGRDSGSGVGGHTVNNYYITNVAGSVLTEKRLVDIVRTQVLQFNGRNSVNGLSLR